MGQTLYLRGATVHIEDVLDLLKRTGRPYDGVDLGNGQYELYYLDGNKKKCIRFNQDFVIQEEREVQ